MTKKHKNYLSDLEEIEKDLNPDYTENKETKVLCEEMPKEYSINKPRRVCIKAKIVHD